MFVWYLPKLSAKTTLRMGSWAMLAFIIVGSMSTSELLSPTSQLYASNVHPTPAAAMTASVRAVTALPGGPSGQLLPPGTLAAPFTYANAYSRGQCTWYVAGRRPIPRGWGNANTWYGRARAAGWSVGTTPAIGAVAWTGTGYYGHVAVVEAIEGNKVLISEMNYIGPYKIDKRWVTDASFKYIY